MSLTSSWNTGMRGAGSSLDTNRIKRPRGVQAEPLKVIRRHNSPS